MKVTTTEEEVLYLLAKERYTPKQIAIRRKTGIRTVYKTIRSLRNKGLIDKQNNAVHEIKCTNELKRSLETNQIRLHGQEINIKILFKDQRYEKKRQKANLLYIDGNTIRLYRDSIEIYLIQSFYGKNPQSALTESWSYMNRLLNRLELDLSIILRKSRYQNIKIVKAHYSEINNELAKEYEVDGKHFQVKADEDGKVWGLIDNSFNLHELETIHPETSKKDMEIVQKHFNDLRNNPQAPSLSELAKVMQELMQTTKEIALQNKETAAGLNAVIQLIKGKEQPFKEIKDQKTIPDYVG